jgi:hypothetical protein
MHLELEYPFDVNNQGFKYVFDKIYENIDVYYPNITKSKQNTTKLFYPCVHNGGRCGVSSMKITNKTTNKTTVLSFWDRTMEIIGSNALGWETMNVVHVIGGLGVYLNSEKIQTQYNIKFTPFLYPLEFLNSYQYIQNYRKTYNPKERIKKACFIGLLYDSRKQVTDILQQHPLFKIIGSDVGLKGEKYYEEMSKYALTLSLNGNGEWCLRDVESMGLGIPTLRAEIKTPFYKELTPGVNYVKGMEMSSTAHLVFPGITPEEVAQSYIKAVEENIHNDDLLLSISKNNIEYYDKYLIPDKIINEFFNVFDLDILK